MIGKSYRRAQNKRNTRRHEGIEEYCERRELREEIPLRERPRPAHFTPPPPSSPEGE